MKATLKCIEFNEFETKCNKGNKSKLISEDKITKHGVSYYSCLTLRKQPTQNLTEQIKQIQQERNPITSPDHHVTGTMNYRTKR